jgi:hypothetical protein
MQERQMSLADRFVYVANEIRKIDEDVDNNNPHRYPLRKMRQTAEKVLLEAMATANEIADTARVLKDELRSNLNSTT